MSANILFDLNPERRALQSRLKDFDNLENKFFPEIKDAVNSLGYDCVASLVLGNSGKCYDKFRVSAVKNNRIKAMVEVQFPNVQRPGEYKVSRLEPDSNAVISSEKCSEADLVDMIESMMALDLGGASEG